MGLFSWWQQGEQATGTVDLRSRRGGERAKSIYEHLLAHGDAEGLGLLPGGERLPDEAVAARRAAMQEQSEPAIETLLGLVRAYCEAPTGESLRAVYEHAVRHPALGEVSALFTSLLTAEGLSPERLHHLARALATEGGDREPVKLGILLLGLFRRSEDLPVLRTLGRHEEFARHAATALLNCVKDGEEEVWQLARHLSGWGRIRLVKRLLNTRDRRIRDWLLREGFRNSIRNEHLALGCAEAGGLREALAESEVDEELLLAAGEILQALLNRDSAKGSIDEYPEGVEVVESYLLHLEGRPPAVPHSLAVSAILAFVTESAALWSARAARGWTAGRREAIEAQCRAYLARPEWPAVVRTALTADDDALLAAAERVAVMLGIVTWERHWKVLLESPQSPLRWRVVIAQCPDGHLTQVVSLAEERLPLKQLAREAEDAAEIESRTREQACLAAVLKAVARTPGLGQDLIKVGLRCPLTEARAAAVEALSQWGPEQFPEGLRHTLGFAASVEPVEAIRSAMRSLLAGERST